MSRIAKSPITVASGIEVKGADGRVGVLGVTVLTSVGREDIRSAGFRTEFVTDLSSLVMKFLMSMRIDSVCGTFSAGVNIST